MALTQGLSVTILVVMTIVVVRSQAHHCAGSPVKTVVTRPNANVGIIGFFIRCLPQVRNELGSRTCHRHDYIDPNNNFTFRATRPKR